MLTTQFLAPREFAEYSHWLKSQDPETIHEYFGCALDAQSIDFLIEKFTADSSQNYFLVAKVGLHWVGTIHIASHGNVVEFGVIVGLQYRNQGIAGLMMDEAITWARNRFFTNLYMHCIYHNIAIKKLCDKHGLQIKNMMGDSEGNLILPPPNPITFFKEQAKISQQNWRSFLKVSQLSF